ncbi:MAG TPA: hypothetical protein VGU01_12910 [Sphingomicrobium sp.]|nr:hypothetical protein [Sphingomicrobium sp.]
MAYASDLHIAVYQVLDQVMTSQVPPPGATATIHSIIDDLLAASAPEDMVRRAEEIALELHLLSMAISKRDGESASSARRNLQSLAGQWLDCQIRPKRSLLVSA